MGLLSNSNKHVRFILCVFFLLPHVVLIFLSSFSPRTNHQLCRTHFQVKCGCGCLMLKGWQHGDVLCPLVHGNWKHKGYGGCVSNLRLLSKIACAFICGEKEPHTNVHVYGGWSEQCHLNFGWNWPYNRSQISPWMDRPYKRSIFLIYDISSLTPTIVFTVELVIWFYCMSCGFGQ